VFPYENPYLQPFEKAVRALNPVVAVKVRSAAVHAALSTVWVFLFFCFFFFGFGFWFGFWEVFEVVDVWIFCFLFFFGVCV
jgi:hypothetical protein